MKKSFWKALSVLSLSFALCFLGGMPSADAAVLQDGNYWVQMADSDLFVAPRDSSHSARIVISKNTPKNSWNFQHLGNDIYKITYGYFVLDLKEGKKFNGVHIIAWNWHGGNNQRWKVTKVGKYYQFVSVKTGQGLDLPNNKRVSGTALQGYTHNSTMAQKFEIIPVKRKSSGAGDR